MKGEIICTASCGHRAEAENFENMEDKDLQEIGFWMDENSNLRCDKCTGGADFDEETGKNLYFELSQACRPDYF